MAWMSGSVNLAVDAGDIHIVLFLREVFDFHAQRVVAEMRNIHTRTGAPISVVVPDDKVVKHHALLLLCLSRCSFSFLGGLQTWGNSVVEVDTNVLDRFSRSGLKVGVETLTTIVPLFEQSKNLCLDAFLTKKVDCLLKGIFVFGVTHCVFQICERSCM